MEILLKGILIEDNVGTHVNLSQIMEFQASVFYVYGESICELEGFIV